MDFDRDKNKQKRSHRVLKEDATIERRSAFTIRLVCISVYDVAARGLRAAGSRLLHVYYGAFCADIIVGIHQMSIRRSVERERIYSH